MLYILDINKNASIISLCYCKGCFYVSMNGALYCWPERNKFYAKYLKNFQPFFFYHRHV